jgi:hypothetical protein
MKEREKLFLMIVSPFPPGPFCLLAIPNPLLLAIVSSHYLLRPIWLLLVPPVIVLAFELAPSSAPIIIVVPPVPPVVVFTFEVIVAVAIVTEVLVERLLLLVVHLLDIPRLPFPTVRIRH